jgi:tetratricopeptide (TPR) repeat protein
VSPNARFARGTRTPPYLDREPSAPKLAVDDDHEVPTQREPSLPLLSTQPLTDSTAEEAFQRAQVALRGDRVDDAVSDLELATQLAPNEARYFAALAWARFCRAPDKTRIALQTRQMLNRAIARSDAPILPHYYLGMVERILNRREQALEHFREVLDLQPNHQEAATEIRFLLRKA